LRRVGAGFRYDRGVSDVLPRRGFLKLGLAGGALFAAAGSGLAWFRHGYGALLAPEDRPIALTTKEFAIAKSIVRALLPEDGDLPSGESLGVAQRFDEELWAADPDVRSDLQWGLQLLEHAPRLHGLRGRLTEMSPDGAADYLARVLAGRHEALRQVVIATRQALHLFYYANRATWAAIGYGGPFVEKAVPPETHRHYRSLMRVS
jgi:hypothetical protein